MHQKFFTQKELAKILNISEATVSRDINNGGRLSTLKPFVVSGTRLYSVYDVAKLLGLTIMQVFEKFDK